MYLVTSTQMRRIEAEAVAGGLSHEAMMRHAGTAVAEVVREIVPPGAAVVLVGPGNNGGDGLVAARALAVAGYPVRVLLWQWRAGLAAAGDLASLPDVRIASAEDVGALEVLAGWLDEATVVVDALLGTGANRPLEGLVAGVLDAVRAARARRSALRVVAVDVPTGLDSDSGAVDPHAVPADVTVTFGCPKVGHYSLPGAAAVGELRVNDIGIPPEVMAGVAEADGPLKVTTAAAVRALLPERPPGAHKGTFGRALVVAGSTRYTGAAYLAAAAAYRTGCGLVTVALPASLHTAIAGLLPEATYLPLVERDGVVSGAAAAVVRAAARDFDALLVGPGLTDEPPVAELVGRLVEDPPAPLVLDADGLNVLARREGGPAGLPAESILTPHPGEMARLIGWDVQVINHDRIAVARQAAAAWRQIVVLKGAYTVIAAPDGGATVNPFATPALARAGTGDVLAGLIAGLLAQGLRPFDAAAAAAFLHGLAGQLAGRAIGVHSTLARDVLDRVAEAMRMVVDGQR
jgi:NAD(P)H-hydrate epimerase